MSSSLQKSAPPASAVEGQWLRDADSLLLLCPAWEEVKVALSVYVQDFIKDICEKKPSMSQIMFDVVGHRLMEAVMGDSLQYQPLLLKEPYMSSEVRHTLKKELHQMLTEYLGQRIKKEGFISAPTMKQFDKAMTGIYRARVRVTDDGDVSQKAGEAIVHLLRNHRPERPNSAAAAEGSEPPPEAQEDDLWDVVEGEVLPPAIRRYLWTRRLKDARKEKAWIHDLQRFEVTCAQQPNRKSPISSLFKAGVSQLLKDMSLVMAVPPSMAPALERLLDAHYTITGRYTRRYVNLLLPLLLVFPYKGPKPRVEEDARLLTMLTLLYAQTDPQVVAQKAAALLREADPSLEAHINRLFYNQSLETTAPMLSQQELEDEIAKMTPIQARQTTLLTLVTSLTALFRFWVEEAFVGVLRPAAMLLVWDSCLLVGWDEQIPEFCGDLMILMREDLFRCKTVREAVLLVCEETREIMTEELQDVFKDRRGLGDDSSSDDSDDR